MSTDDSDENSETTKDGRKTKTVTGTWRCQSGYHDKNGNFVVRYDSGWHEYTRRVPVIE